jgi:hypothetical protein
MAGKMLSLASLTTQFEHRDRYFNLATKLQRTMVAQVDALTRLKGKSEPGQVGQVTVTDGGQAIVGGTVNIDARRTENGG